MSLHILDAVRVALGHYATPLSPPPPWDGDQPACTGCRVRSWTGHPSPLPPPVSSCACWDLPDVASAGDSAEAYVSASAALEAYHEKWAKHTNFFPEQVAGPTLEGGWAVHEISWLRVEARAGDIRFRVLAAKPGRSRPRCRESADAVYREIDAAYQGRPIPTDGSADADRTVSHIRRLCLTASDVFPC